VFTVGIHRKGESLRSRLNRRPDGSLDAVGIGNIAAGLTSRWLGVAERIDPDHRMGGARSPIRVSLSIQVKGGPPAAFASHLASPAYTSPMVSPPEPPNRAGQARNDRYRKIGSYIGTVTGAVVIFAYLAFGEHPHRLGVAIITTLIFVALASALDLFLHRQEKRRTPPSEKDRWRS
jgi:hypothetical protein